MEDGEDHNPLRLGMFSFGSNHQQQMRARVKNACLQGRPAYLQDYTRVFGANAADWEGSVASVARKEGARVYGCFYLLTPAEVAMIDVFEGVEQGHYVKTPVMCKVTTFESAAAAILNPSAPEALSSSSTSCGSSSSSSTTTAASESSSGTSGSSSDGDEGSAADSLVVGNCIDCPAFTYILSKDYTHIRPGGTFETFTPPSSQYLSAVHRCVTQNWPCLAKKPIDILHPTTLKKESAWSYPLQASELPLAAFLLEVGIRVKQPWVFPKELFKVVTCLRDGGIGTTALFISAVLEEDAKGTEGGGALRAALQASVGEGRKGDPSAVGDTAAVVGEGGAEHQREEGLGAEQTEPRARRAEAERLLYASEVRSIVRSLADRGA